MHVRRAIREAVAIKLTGLPLTGERVFTSRVRELRDNELPALIVETPSESVSYGQGGPVRPRVQSREQVVNVVVVASAAEDVDDVLDDIAEQVEAALAADPTLGLGAKDLRLTGTQSAIAGDGPDLRGVARLQYTVSVSTREGVPQSMHAA
jgi:hypothetical protein